MSVTSILNTAFEIDGLEYCNTISCGGTSVLEAMRDDSPSSCDMYLRCNPDGEYGISVYYETEWAEWDPNVAVEMSWYSTIVYIAPCAVNGFIFVLSTKKLEEQVRKTRSFLQLSSDSPLAVSHLAQIAAQNYFPQVSKRSLIWQSN